MERKIGEIFEFGGEWYQCVGAIQGCRECSFRTQDYCTRHSECFSVVRSDGISVIFKKLEKVETPFSCNYYGDARLVMMQEYQLFDANVICCYSMPSMYITDYKHKQIAIEIKQNKEGMEEKKVKLDKLVENYISNKITYKEFEVEVKMLYTDKEGSKPNLKPFDIEAAKAGKPVCTRDGRKARIICFDRCSNKPIVALVTTDDREYLTEYYCDGRISHNSAENNDLMMYPEKKEGWVNVHRIESPGDKDFPYVSSLYPTKKDALNNVTSDVIDTVKICWEE